MGSFKYPKKDEVIVEFSITDSGIGISKENYKKVFESFSQEGTYINRRFGGTGLGLAITKRFVEIQKGKINLKSEPGKGSTFTVSIPYLIPKNISKTKKEIKQTNELLYDLEGAKILLVEDNPMNQMIAETFLTKWNAKVSIANNRLEALAALKQETFNVVLMDIQMPEMDGYEATRQIRLEKKYDKLPIIALTASAMIEVRKKITAAGMNNMVTKPFEPKELFTAVLKSLYK
jgi:CheY-like chemotaxis protein